MDGSDSGTAWWAHIGGFLVGMVLIGFFRQKNVPLFDGMGRFGSDNPNVVDLAERQTQNSKMPNNQPHPPTPPTPLRPTSGPIKPKGPWDK